MVRWTHHPDNVVYTGHNGTLRYLSLYDNKHLEFFEGHTEKYVPASSTHYALLYLIHTLLCSGIATFISNI